MATWDNFDGLEVNFGLDRSALMPGGKTAVHAHKTLKHKFDFNDIANTDTAAPSPHEASIPAGSVIVRAYLYVTEAFAGATATLDIGLKQDDGTNTDDDGIDAAIAVTALDAVGDVILCDGALVAQETGDLTGVRFTEDQWIMTTWDAAAFTAGEATLVVEYLEIEDV